MADYYWQGYHPGIDAQVAAEALDKLQQDGELNVPAVVEAARPEDSPLHAAFEWDDGIAAEQYRRSQARTLLSHIRVRYEDHSPPERVYFNVSTEHARAYYTKARVLEDDELREALIAKAHRDLLAWQVRYRELAADFGGVFAAIDQMQLTAAAV